ncbi:Cytochrome P450 3A9-like protein [Dinothrombium tinctorium]|uniref:Cytochrome P450 3A9-like protein n=1 Tax=Dinothrombium tinctorium TaxID=1965070 RepID=A0A443QI59_9ACAR|nr:Cytochrome P450 3A9-like protein [Dinothrombium tinctorium]
MFTIVDHCAKETVEKLNKQLETCNEVNIQDTFGELITDVVARVAFATDLSADSQLKKKFIKTVVKIFNPPAWSPILFLIAPIFSKLINLITEDPLDFFKHLVDEIISKRSEENKSGQKHIDFLQLLLDDEMDKSDEKKDTNEFMGSERTGVMQPAPFFINIEKR